MALKLRSKTCNITRYSMKSQAGIIVACLFQSDSKFKVAGTIQITFLLAAVTPEPSMNLPFFYQGWM